MNLESDKDIYFYLSRGYSIKKKGKNFEKFCSFVV